MESFRHDVRRLVRPLCGALVLHALGVLAIDRWLRETPDAPALAAPSETELEIAITEDSAPRERERERQHEQVQSGASSTADGVTRAPGVRAGAKSVGPRGEERAARPDDIAKPPALEAQRPGEEPSYSLDPSAPAEPGASERQGVGSTKPPIDLGIGPGSWDKWGPFTTPPPSVALAPSADAPRAPAPVSSTGGLAEAMQARDREIGLGPSGTVLSATREVASSSEAPRYGSAQFAVSVFQGGQVEVSVQAASADTEAWTEVGKLLAAALRKRPPRVPTGRRGVRLVIALDAQERTPTGSLARPPGVQGSVTPPTLRNTDEAKAFVRKNTPSMTLPPGAPAEQKEMAPIIDAPGVFVGAHGKLGEASIGVGAFNEVGLGDPPSKVAGGLVVKGNIDPTNLVGRSSRVLSTRVVHEAFF